MPYYTGLARVARTTGYPVKEISGWKTRGNGTMNTVQSVMCHHTAGGSRGNYPSMNVVKNGRPGLSGPLAHYGIGRDGTIYVIAAGIAYHAGKVSKTAYTNRHSIGIEAENTGTGERWSDAQLDAYVKLCRALIDEFGLPVSAVVGHKEAAVPKGRKVDPAFIRPRMSMNDFRRYVKRGYYTKAGKTTAKKNNTRKDWLSMATEAQLRKIIREETRLAKWSYKPKNDDWDMCAYNRETYKLLKDLNKKVAKKVWGYKNQYAKRDIYGYVRETNKASVATQGELAGILKALEQLSEGKKVNLAEVRKAAQEGVAKAIKDLEADVTLTVSADKEDD
ncbi:peptidoglycan recognition family protein [Auritidibacter ignavus]|uniref:N-acetylmuramoyl-L-alanine amidase n=1 Tax=Auritidibacter ignavus TaxID=678932 RepID=A0AAJ6DD67_9MICC|nr:peptidoglycan recognition family protein [Auritidibacter ignavus]WGH93886.1 peptidoglycan recognition family protein [Auritidibacter ignavus]